MKKLLLILTAFALYLTACTKAGTIDHHISAEFPATEAMEEITISFGGDADIVISDTGVTSDLAGITTETLSDEGMLVRYKNLALFTGAWTDLDSLLEETFWTGPALQWIYAGDFASMEEDFAATGFVNCLRARGLDASGNSLYASSNTYDKIRSLSATPLRFTVMVKEEVQ